MELDVLTLELAQAAALEAKPTTRRLAERHPALRVNSEFQASPERIFDAWVDPKIAGKWLFATASRPMARVMIDARVGGLFCFADRQDGDAAEHFGVYLEIVRPRRLVFTLSIENNPKVRTHVSVDIVPRDEGCELTLTHEHVPPDYAGHAENRWTGMLYGLAETLKSQSGCPNSPVNRAMPMSIKSGFHGRVTPLQSDMAATVRVHHGSLAMTDGPFAETKEHLAGF